MDSIQTATHVEGQTQDAPAEEVRVDALTGEGPTGEALTEGTVAEGPIAEDTLAEGTLAEGLIAEDALAQDAVASDVPAVEALAQDTAAEDVPAVEALAEEPIAEDALAIGAPTDGAPQKGADPDIEETVQVPNGSGEMSKLDVEDWDYQEPKRGQIRTGVILSIGQQEIIVDVDAKRDGLVPYADIQRMGAEAVAALSVGDEIMVYILRPEDQDGNLLVSLFQARQAQAWQRVAQLLESGEIREAEVIGYNKGGLVVPVEDIRGFVPASQVPGFPQGLRQEERLNRLSLLVGEKVQVKVIEFNQRNRRLILSATAAQRLWRKHERERLLEELREGEVRSGVVSSLCSFGAFVDLGGADGLVHLSELSWRRVRHPREVLRVGEEVDVYVLRLDRDRQRIGLSLKRLQAEPWALVEEKYELGQLVEGEVSNVVDFGAFAEIEDGVEGLIHVSELSDKPISHPKEVVKKGDLLLLRIIRIDVRRKRLGLSLKRVLESEWAEWAARLALDEREAAKAAESVAAEAGEMDEPQAAASEEPDEVQEPPVADAEAVVDGKDLATMPADDPALIEETPEPPEAEALPEAEDAKGDEELVTMLSEEPDGIQEAPGTEAEEMPEAAMAEVPGEDEAPLDVSQAEGVEELDAPALEEADEVVAEVEQPKAAEGEVPAATEVEEPAEETELPAADKAEDIEEPAAMTPAEPDEDREDQETLEAEDPEGPAAEGPEQPAVTSSDESGEGDERSEPSGDEAESTTSPVVDVSGDGQEFPEPPDAGLEDNEDAEQALDLRGA